MRLILGAPRRHVLNQTDTPWFTIRLAGAPHSESERRALLERMAERFAHPETAGIDWELLRDGKRRARPIP
jgi:hypothetical protein